MPVSLVRKDGQVFDDVDDREAVALMASGDFVKEGMQQERPATNVGRAENLGMGERARASIRDWAAGIGVTDPSRQGVPQFTGVPLTVPAEGTAMERAKAGGREVLHSLDPRNIADPALFSDPVVGGPKTLLNVLTAVAAGKAMPRGSKVTPGAQALVESGATQKLANAVRLQAGEGISESQLGRALEMVRSHATAGRKGAAASSEIAIPSNAAELVSTLEAAAKRTSNPADRQLLNRLAKQQKIRATEVIRSPEGMDKVLGGVGMFSPKIGLARKALGMFSPTEEMIMNRMVKGAMKLTQPRVPRGWHQYSRPAVGSLVGSVVGNMEAGDYVRGKGARIGTAR